MLPILHLASFLKIWCLTTIGGCFLKVSVFSLVLEPSCSSILKDCYLSAMLTQASRRLDIREFCLFISGLLNWIASADSRHILNTVICRSEHITRAIRLETLLLHHCAVHAMAAWPNTTLEKHWGNEGSRLYKRACHRHGRPTSHGAWRIWPKTWSISSFSVKIRNAP